MHYSVVLVVGTTFDHCGATTSTSTITSPLLLYYYYNGDEFAQSGYFHITQPQSSPLTTL